ncbi:glycosyltransferase [Paenibacillus polymyxa]|uniref:glycosyltransferase n=1 Tax=Paenibacillus TaxID=44249 RepID=UPI0020252533|nr:glycosyltransferase [Paenibacillus polymyxa]URJ38631.1 glycosyltransferase [Paenibacillus polymyxa]
MISISLCMIVKNDQNTIGRCLESIHSIVDEINIVDTGSQDRTIDICRNFTDRIFPFEWVDHFALARNYSFEQATQEYILWLDADDILKEQDAVKLLELKQTLDSSAVPTVDSVSMNYHYGFDDHGNVTLHFRRNRLIRRSAGFRWHGAVHEYLAVDGNIQHADISITHTRTHTVSPGRNLRIYEKLLAQGHAFSPRDLYYYANELRDNERYEQAVQAYQNFLDTGQCWVEDAISACSKMADCLQQLGKLEQSITAALHSLTFDTPRADLCCRIGHYFLHKNEISKAIYWYDMATTLNPPDTMGPVQDAYQTWFPHIQLCICHFRMKDYTRANWHNEQAAMYVPNDPHVLHNRQFFSSILNPPQ